MRIYLTLLHDYFATLSSWTFVVSTLLVLVSWYQTCLMTVGLVRLIDSTTWLHKYPTLWMHLLGSCPHTRKRLCVPFLLFEVLKTVSTHKTILYSCPLLPVIGSALMFRRNECSPSKSSIDQANIHIIVRRSTGWWYIINPP